MTPQLRLAIGTCVFLGFGAIVELGWNACVVLGRWARALKDSEPKA